MENVAIARVRSRTDALENEVRQLKAILGVVTNQLSQLRASHDRLERIVSADLARREVPVTELIGATAAAEPVPVPQQQAQQQAQPVMDPRMFAAMQQQQHFQPRSMGQGPGPGPAMSNDRAMEMLRHLRQGM